MDLSAVVEDEEILFLLNSYFDCQQLKIDGIWQSVSIYKNKAPRPPPSTVDFYFSDITVNTTPIVDGDSAKQNEIIAQQILFTQCHRYLEQDSNKGIEVLESAEYEWKSATKNGQQQTDDLFSSPINSILS
ncbi:unnamed protein product [Rotaria magnacalcarata]|uniref:Uncharacterized protein n=1 Tax=Rotaria magnacalcarata TaxID=392030 RepID=A0A814GXZ7_9BILA|nr:unnamed protein product [Rotaria magnacalcarata]